MKNNKKRWIIISLIFITLILWSCDMRLKTVKYAIQSDKVEKRIRIALITDLHSCKYGDNQEKLIKAVEEENPDIVLLGGDIFDDHMSYDNSKITVRQLADKYPCYYVSGNHEYWSYDINTATQKLEDIMYMLLQLLKRNMIIKILILI